MMVLICELKLNAPPGVQTKRSMTGEVADWAKTIPGLAHAANVSAIRFCSLRGGRGHGHLDRDYFGARAGVGQRRLDVPEHRDSAAAHRQLRCFGRGP
eukprot:4184261-Pyramimonas_sp.AAC.1